MRWLQIEGVSYWFMFVAAFLGVAIWESFSERRRLTVPASRRWTRHGVIFVVCAGMSALVLRASPVVTAVMVSESRFGLLAPAPIEKRLRPWIITPDIHRVRHSNEVWE